jgi:hypothetical protein
MKYFAFVFFLFFSCQNSVHEDLINASSRINQYPELSLEILKKMDYAQLSDEEKALYGLLLSQALDKNYQLLLKCDSFLDFSVNYYKKEHDEKQLAHCYLYKARLNVENKKTTDAIQLLLKALSLEKEVKDPALYGKIYFDLGSISYNQESLNVAIVCFEIAIEYLKRANEQNNIALTFIEISKSYQYLEKYDEALASAKEAMKYASEAVVIGDALNEIGGCYTCLQEYDSAHFYIQKSLQYPFLNKENLASRALCFADLFFDIHQYDSAAYYAENTLNNAAGKNTIRECYRVLANTAYIKNNQEELGIYLDKYYAYSDSINLLKSEPKMDVLQKLNSVDQAANDIDRGKTNLILVLVVILFLCFLIILFLIKKYMKQSTNISQKRKVETSYLSLYKELLEKLKQEKIRYNIKSDSKEQFKVTKEFYDRLLLINNEKLFLQKMNIYLNKLPAKLQQRYPKLKYKEIVMCCLTALQLPSADIAQIFDYKSSISLYKFKQRLKQKLNLGSTRNLEGFLLTIMEET